MIDREHSKSITTALKTYNFFVFRIKVVTPFLTPTRLLRLSFQYSITWWFRHLRTNRIPGDRYSFFKTCWLFTLSVKKSLQKVTKYFTDQIFADFFFTPTLITPT